MTRSKIFDDIRSCSRQFAKSNSVELRKMLREKSLQLRSIAGISFNEFLIVWTDPARMDHQNGVAKRSKGR